MPTAKTMLQKARRAGALRFEDLRPFLADASGYEAQAQGLARQIVRAGLPMFDDLVAHPATVPGPDSEAQDPLDIYLAEIRRIDSTTREEEFELARGYELSCAVFEQELTSGTHCRGEAHALREALDRGDTLVRAVLEKLDRLRPRQERDDRAIAERIEMAKRRLAEVHRVRSNLIARSLHLVPGMARRYRNMGVTYLDLIQEGNAALLRAADKYEWRKDVRFSSYAQWWIQQAILKCIYCQSRVVRLPVYLNQKLKRINDVNRRAASGMGRELTAEEISQKLEEPVGRIRRAITANRSTLSLDQTVDPRNEFSLRDLLVDRRPMEVQDEPEGPGLEERMAELLDDLSEKERRILQLRYGIGGRKPMTLEEVSKIFEVSRERIRQIQVQAIQKLQRPSRRKMLAAYI